MSTYSPTFHILRFIFLLTFGGLPTLALAPRETVSEKRAESPTRRGFISKALPSVFLVSCFRVEPVMALKERNEALCGTGFFTNIAQYMCTELGDISDEGKATKISEEEVNSMDSLLSKMGVEKDSIVNDVKKEQVENTAEKK